MVMWFLPLDSQYSSRMAECTVGQDKTEERRDCGIKTEGGRGCRKGKTSVISLERVWEIFWFYFSTFVLLKFKDSNK
jgi:hypothetical protein